MKCIKDRDRSNGHKSRLVIFELKTAKARRTFVLTPEIFAKLRRQRAGVREESGTSWQEHGLIFARKVETPLGSDAFSHAFLQTTPSRRAGPLAPARAEALRRLPYVGSGTPLHVVVSEVLGHASIAIRRTAMGISWPTARRPPRGR